MEQLLEEHLKKGIKKLDSKLNGVEELISNYRKDTGIDEILLPAIKKLDPKYTRAFKETKEQFKLVWDSYIGEYFDAKVKAFRLKYKTETAEKMQEKGLPKKMSKFLANIIPSTEDKELQGNLAYTLGGFIVGGGPRRFITLSSELAGVSENETIDGEFFWRHFNNIKDTVEYPALMMGGKALSFLGIDSTFDFKPETIIGVTIGAYVARAAYMEFRNHLWTKHKLYTPNYMRFLSPTGLYPTLVTFATDWVMTADENSKIFHKLKNGYDIAKENITKKIKEVRNEFKKINADYNNNPNNNSNNACS